MKNPDLRDYLAVSLADNHTDMTTTPDTQKKTYPPIVDFPDPRNFPDPREQKKEKIALPRPTLGTILSRMNHPDARSVTGQQTDNDGPPVESHREHETLRDKQRELARIQAETTERIRVARELELLIAARENLLDKREALLNARLAGHSSDKEISTLEKSLSDTRKALNKANQALAEMDGVVSGLRKEIENIKNAGIDLDNEESSNLVNEYTGVTDQSLAEQVAFLREREAFIEQSENVLFDKAQQLQEWEARLEQKDPERLDAPADPGEYESQIAG